jgi:hypothetical protein
VDISGADTYDDAQPFSMLFNATVSAIGGDTSVPLALHETGYIPNPADMFNNNAAPWVLFSVWAEYGMDTSLNSVDEIQATYSDPHTIPRDEVPDLN